MKVVKLLMATNSIGNPEFMKKIVISKQMNAGVREFLRKNKDSLGIRQIIQARASTTRSCYLLSFERRSMFFRLEMKHVLPTRDEACSSD
jgi:hypothetical protein